MARKRCRRTSPSRWIASDQLRGRPYICYHNLTVSMLAWSNWLPLFTDYADTNRNYSTELSVFKFHVDFDVLRLQSAAEWWCNARNASASTHHGYYIKARTECNEARSCTGLTRGFQRWNDADKSQRMRMCWLGVVNICAFECIWSIAIEFIRWNELAVWNGKTRPSREYLTAENLKNYSDRFSYPLLQYNKQKQKLFCIFYIA